MRNPFNMQPPMPSVPGWQGGNWQPPEMGGGYGGPQGGLGALAGQAQPMGGYKNYLEGLGWNGAPGTRFDFAQGLRDQGQHPFMDYMHSLHPNGGGYDNSGINPQPLSSFMPGPRPGGLSGNDTGYGGLSALLRRNPMIAR